MIWQLSYPIFNGLPAYGRGAVEIKESSLRDFSQGDSCRVAAFSMENHWGTHVDCPAHFFINGKTVDQYSPGRWVFDAVQIVDVIAEPGQLIGTEDLNLASDDACTLLLLRTGFGQRRGEKVYYQDNPGIRPEVADYLRGIFPRLRAVGFDFISVSSFVHREIGREAHCAFLREAEGRELLLVEDMRLPAEVSSLKMVVVAPLMLQGFDAAPCTVLGFK